MFRRVCIIIREFFIMYAKVTKLIDWKHFKDCKQPDILGSFDCFNLINLINPF